MRLPLPHLLGSRIGDGGGGGDSIFRFPISRAMHRG